MADSPSRSLVLYGDGLARFIEPSHIHLHALASFSSCGFLGLSNSPPSESEDERIVRELAVLLDACEAYLDRSGDADIGECRKKSISERFMGMKAALLTSNSNLKSFGAKIGVTVLQFNDLTKSNHQTGLSVDFAVSELLKLLGFQNGKTQEKNEFDLLFVHIGTGENMNYDKIISNDVEFINGLVGGILHQAKPGSDIGLRLHLSLVMSYGNISNGDDCSLSLSTSKDERNSHLSAIFPCQSYTMKGESPLKDVRHHTPMLVAQWQYAVTRKDMAETYSFNDFKERGGNLAIPANRFLHEIAFKLWKAPKYGA